LTYNIWQLKVEANQAKTKQNMNPILSSRVLESISPNALASMHKFTINTDGRIIEMTCPVSGNNEDWQRYSEQGDTTGEYMCGYCKVSLDSAVDKHNANFDSFS